MKLSINGPKTVVILAKKFLNETDIDISKDEEYLFEAVGFWKDLLTKCDADGYTNWYMNMYNNKKRSVDHNWFALMGNINNSNDFLIGKQNKIVFNNEGKLSCYANDVKGFYWNNSGQITLTITRIK